MNIFKAISHWWQRSRPWATRQELSELRKRQDKTMKTQDELVADAQAIIIKLQRLTSDATAQRLAFDKVVERLAALEASINAGAAKDELVAAFISLQNSVDGLDAEIPDQVTTPPAP